MFERSLIGNFFKKRKKELKKQGFQNLMSSMRAKPIKPLEWICFTLVGR